MRQSKGFASVILVLAVMIFAVGVLWFVMQKSETVTPSITNVPTPTLEPIENWKTYESSTHNFSFQYPSNWQIGVFKNAPDILTLQPQTSFVEESQENSIVIAVSNHCLNTQCLSVLSLDEMVDQWSATKTGETTVGGVQAYKVSLNNNKTGYMFIKEDDFFMITTDKYPEELDQIISTFKFL